MRCLVSHVDVAQPMLAVHIIISFSSYQWRRPGALMGVKWTSNWMVLQLGIRFQVATMPYRLLHLRSLCAPPPLCVICSSYPGIFVVRLFLACRFTCYEPLNYSDSEAGLTPWSGILFYLVGSFESLGLGLLSNWRSLCERIIDETSCGVGLAGYCKRGSQNDVGILWIGSVCL